MIDVKKHVRKNSGLVAALLALAAAVVLFTCEKVPDFCGRGEKYDPGIQFCSGGTAHDMCGGKTYNPLTEGCVDDNIDKVGARCQDGSVVEKGTPCGGYTLTTAATPVTGGYVERIPDEPHYKAATAVTLTATARDGYEFVGWAGSVKTEDYAPTIIMNANKPMVAMFKPIDKPGSTTRTLITAAFPENGGNVSVNPVKVAYSKTDEVTVTAAENPGYEFDGWSGTAGTATKSGRVVTLTMGESQTLVAVFKPKIKKLTVNTSPDDGGAVFVNGTALNGITNQDAGTEIVIWARAAEEYSFTKWSGGASGTANPATIKLTDSDMTITANFGPRSGGSGGSGDGQQTLSAACTLSTSATPGGRVSLSPNDPKKIGYMIGTVVTATAVADSGYKFRRWSGAADRANNPVTITIKENGTLTAEFMDERASGSDTTTAYTLSTGVSPSAGGTLKIDPSKASYAPNEKVTVTATANAGYSFSGWGGASTSTGASVTITMNGNKTLTANFKSTEQSQTYTITFNPNGGTVSPTTAATVATGKLTTLPTPTRSGYAFDGWFTDTTGGTKVTAATTFTQNTTIHAQWTLVYTIALDANGGSLTTKSVSTGAGGKLTSTLPTPAMAGHSFVGWFTSKTEGTQVTTSTVFDENTTIYARWTKIVYTVTFNTSIGTVSPTSMIVGDDGKIAELPTPTGGGDYEFAGWYTSATGNTKETLVTEDKKYTANTTIYARWLSASTMPGLVFDLESFKKGIFYTGGWYAFAYSEGPGTSSATPANVADYSTVFANAGGKVTLKVNGASYYYAIGAGIGIMWFDSAGLATNMDISGYKGVYITYSLTGDAPVYMQISSEQVNTGMALTEYDEYQKVMTPSTSSSRVGFVFSDFEQDGWGGVRVPLETVLRSSHGFNFQTTNDGTATLTITRVELYK